MDPTSRNWDSNSDSCPSVSHVWEGLWPVRQHCWRGEFYVSEWQIRHDDV